MALRCGHHCSGLQELHCRVSQCHEQHQLVRPSLLYLISFDFLSTPISSLTSLFRRSVEHDHVKANLPAKLLHFRTFGKMELSKFKEIILSADYKICQETKKSSPTWYHLIADVFVKFLYKVTIPPYVLYDIILNLLVPYIVALVL